MDIHYIYAECPHSENASASGVNTESFDYKTALDSSAEAKVSCLNPNRTE